MTPSLPGGRRPVPRPPARGHRVLSASGVGGAAALLVRAAYAGLARSPGIRARADRWTRTNYRGEPVDLLGGPAYATAALTTIGFSVRLPPRLRAAALVAGATAAAAGSYDDLRGSARIRGLRGHLRALLRGEPTSGAVKVGAIGVGALAAGCLTQPGSWRRKVAAGVVIAGSANLANLLDLRPGRATKVGLMVAGPLAFGRGGGARVAAAAAGAATGLLPLDLRETTMLGDTGANTMGALIGVGLVQGASARRLTCALVALLGLTAASEFVSFSRVIEENATLRSLDALGRRGE